MITSRHVHHALGPLPKGSRLATPAAEFIGEHLQGAIPALAHAAARVCAQHLHHAHRHSPHLGAREAIHRLAQDLGVTVGQFHSAHPDIVEAYERDAPLGMLIGGALRHTRHEPKTKKESAAMKRHNYSLGGIEHDLRDAVVHHQRAPTKRELAEMKRDLARLGGRMEGGMLLEGGALLEGGRAEGGGWFSDLAKHAVSAAKTVSAHPMGQMMAHQAMQMAMAHPAAQQLAAVHDAASAHPMGAMGMAMAKHMMGGACGCGGACGGRGCGGRRKAHEGVGYAMENVHKGKKFTKKEKEQIIRDLEKYGVGAPAHRGIRKGSLHEAFRR